MSGDGDNGAVRVALRIRPFAQKELLEGCEQALSALDGSTVLVGSDRPFTFDHCFGGTVAQTAVYSTAVQPLVQQCMAGYNATVFAYGQTGSGKTHSLMGAPPTEAGVTEDSGVIPRVISDIFAAIASRPDTEFAVKATVCEVYNEEVRDLLAVPGAPSQPVVIREDVSGSVFLSGLREVEVASAADGLAWIATGVKNRATGATCMNAHSSRSHMVFTLTVEQMAGNEEGYKVSKFNLVDLAGSERQKKTHAEGERFREAVFINKGLLALGNVINALSEPGDAADSLGGNSKTLMLACVSPADSNFEESLNTLRYAQRARSIQNKAVVNTDPQAAQLAALRTQIRELQVALVQARGGAPIDMAEFSGAGATAPPVSSSATLASLRRQGELEAVNRALKAEILALTSQAREAQTATLSLSTRLLELEIERDVWLSGSGPTGTLDDLLVQQRTRIHELEAQVAELTAGARAAIEPLTFAEPDSETAALESEFQTKHTAMLAQLADVTSDIKSKQELLSACQQSGGELEALRSSYEGVIVKLEAELSELQAARSQAIKRQRGVKIDKVAVEELEARIATLSTKLKEANKMVGLKAKSDAHAAQLAEEIATMKAAKVTLQRKLHDEATRFRKLREEKEREVSALKRDQSKKEYELKKMAAINTKQQAVIQRKTEQLHAVTQKTKDQNDLAKWAAQRREERDADKLKKLQELKVLKGMKPPPAPPKPTEEKPAEAAEEPKASNADVVKVIEGAFDTAADALPDTFRAALKKEIVTKATLIRSQQLMGAYITQRRDATKKCNVAREMEAPEEEVKEHQARIAKLSCDISVLQGVISHLDRELKVLHQSQRWSAQLTDLKVAKSAMQCLIACVGTLAESSVTAGAALAEATTASQQQSADMASRLQCRETQLRDAQRKLLQGQVEAEQRVLAMLNHKLDSELGVPSVEELRGDIDAALAEIHTLNDKYEDLAKSAEELAPVQQQTAAKRRGRTLYSDSDDSEYASEFESEYDSESSVEVIRPRAPPAKRGRTSNGSSSSGSSKDAVTQKGAQAAAAADAPPPPAPAGPCECKGMCVRFCGCKSGGRFCDGSCGCKHKKCKNRAAAAPSPIEPPGALEEGEAEFPVLQPAVEAALPVAAVVPATARVAVSTADVENQQKPAVKKMKLLGKGPAIALSGASLRAMTGAGGLPLGL